MRMATPPSQQTSRGQLAAVVLAVALVTLTFLIPLAAIALLATAVLAFAAGAMALRLAHGLDPGAFGAGFYLATLLLLGAGGWQLVHSAHAWQAARSLRKASTEASPPEALVLGKPKPGGAPAAVKQQPFMLLGVALPIVTILTPLPASDASAYRELAKTGAPAERITASGFGMELQLVDN